MCKLAVIFTIPESAFEIALPRLNRLVKLNPKITFFAIIGPVQLFYFPMICDKYFPRSKVRIPILGNIFHIINWISLSLPGIFQFSKNINKKSFSMFKHKKITEMQSRINEIGVNCSFIDYTPMAYWNLDHVLLTWFKKVGKNFDFDHVIFYESDVFTTKSLDLLYADYMKNYDACFADFRIAQKDWRFFNFPLGSRKSILKWLNKMQASKNLYRSIFAGALISRRCFEKLEKLQIEFSGSPYAPNEMRMPTVLSALGFKCGRLDFPLVRYRPELSWDKISSNNDLGIFHPVKNLTPLELN